MVEATARISMLLPAAEAHWRRFIRDETDPCSSWELWYNHGRDEQWCLQAKTYRKTAGKRDDAREHDDLFGRVHIRLTQLRQRAGGR